MERKIKISIIILAFLATIIYFVKRSSQVQSGSSRDFSQRINGIRDISEFPKPNNTHGTIPGKPEITKSKMRRIYQAMILFRKKTGNLPMTSFMAFVGDVVTDYKYYQFSSIKEANDLFHSDDTKFGDLFYTDKVTSNTIPYMQPIRRPDGTAPSEGFSGNQKDVLLFTNIYFHENLSDDRKNTNPIGFYLVLWEDGTVEPIDYTAMRFVPDASPFQEQFPNQEGSSNKSLTFQEYQQRKF